ncbi:MAG: 50S ribosomal protein L31 [Candidatus Moranbacteria bacterium]|nr:50S ribosomal protein L31 [Candidatus Moranbacteria bacterium]
MKKNIHPKYHSEAKIICACGNIITTGSVKPEIKVEVCSACHPFYTGKKRLVDTTGRVDRFKKRMSKTEQMTAEKLKRVEEKKAAKKASTAKVAKKKVVKKVAKPARSATRSVAGGKKVVKKVAKK